MGDVLQCLTPLQPAADRRVSSTRPVNVSRDARRVSRHQQIRQLRERQVARCACSTPIMPSSS
jgi:hypothetical protein